MVMFLVLYILLFLTHYKVLGLIISKISPSQLYSSNDVVLVSLIGLSMMILLSIMSVDFLHRKLAKLLPQKWSPEWLFSTEKSNVLASVITTGIFMGGAAFLHY